MAANDYSNSIKINKSAQEVFDALTQKIPKWWSEDFSGDSQTRNGSFTVRFGNTFKTFSVTELVPNEKVTWRCTASNIDLPELSKKDEWIGTEISWSITPSDFATQLAITHKGLHPEIECYEVCQKGWASFLASLFALLEGGDGLPYIEKK